MELLKQLESKMQALVQQRNQVRQPRRSAELPECQAVDERAEMDGRSDTLAPLVGARYLVIQPFLRQINFGNRILRCYRVSELDCCDEPHLVITQRYCAANAHSRRRSGHKPDHEFGGTVAGL